MHKLFFQFALITLVMPSALLGRHKFIENNPNLGVYQDTTKCFPANGDYILMYRNYKYDPYYGGMAKCVYASQHDPITKDSTLLTNIYGNTKAVARMTFLSDPGYTVRNFVHQKYIKGAHGEFNLTAAYLACPNCHILRSDYIEGGKGCMLWVPEDAVDELNPCCHFVFDLLCGTSRKYKIYEGCK